MFHSSLVLNRVINPLNTVGLLLLCSHSPNDVPPEPQQNVSIIRGMGRCASIQYCWTRLQFHCYMLDKSICRGVRFVLWLLFYF